MENYNLPEPSEEQLAVVNEFSNNNVVVNSCAGSGKTTTVLHMARKYNNRSTLLLTYNARLKIETREKAESLGLNNLEVHTYHSFCVRYLDSKCFTDQGIIKNINKNFRKFDFDSLIMDEFQDSTKLYFDIVLKIIKVLNNPWICIIGDRNQSIYQFNGADSRYIEFAHLIIPSERGWKQLNLSTSYRITYPMASFINNVCLSFERMKATKPGVVVNYTYHGYTPNVIFDDIKTALQKYKPDDIFILAPSVRSKNDKNPVRILSNNLSKSNIKVYVPVNDTEKLDENVLKSKLVFSSFHQAKGSERDVVFLLGFDSSYYEFYNKNASTDNCPNELYVALTRAKKELHIYHSNSKSHFDWVNTGLLRDFANVKGYIKEVIKESSKKRDVAVTELLRHQKSSIIDKIMNIIKYKTVNAPEDVIDIPNIVEQTADIVYHEDVSCINGVAIPAYYELLTKDTMTIANRVGVNLKDINIPADLLKVANKYIASVSGYSYQLNQISDYNWLEMEKLTAATHRLAKSMPNNLSYEITIGASFFGKFIIGQVDAIGENEIYEFKCVSAISPEHIIQLVVYACIYETFYGKKDKYILINILTNEKIEIEYDPSYIEVIRLLICNKYHKNNIMSDDEFLAQFTNNYIIPECAECKEFL